MGRGLHNLLLCFWIIPVLAVGRVVVNKNEEGHRLDDDLDVSAIQDSPEQPIFDINKGPMRKVFIPETGSSNLLNDKQIELTTSLQPLQSICDPEKFVNLSSIFQSTNSRILTNEEDVSFFFCTRRCNKDVCLWWHRGPLVTLNFNKLKQPYDGFSHESSNTQDPHGIVNMKSRSKRASEDTNGKKNVVHNDAKVIGMSFEYASDKKLIEYDVNGSPKVLESLSVKMRIYGKFDNTTLFKLSKFQKCDDPNNLEEVVPIVADEFGTTGTIEVTMPRVGELHEVFLCLKTPGMLHFARQGEYGDEGEFVKPTLVIKLQKPLLPLWLHLFLLLVLLSLSGLFSGLNLGLMSLNKTDLKIIINTGTSAERHYASAIAPVRNHGNFLLCCLLFSNVLVNSSLTILVDVLISGIMAVICATLAIVIFGEIIPQAICSRYGLAVGAKTIYITKFFMLITAPLALPLSKVLDWILGEEIGSVYTRERLKELLRVTKDYHGLATDEVGIISGALDMKSKTVKDVMVRLDNTFMLPITSVLDFDTMSEVEYHGYSRIPVFENERKNIVGLLNIKQLTLLDVNDNIPLKTVVEYYHNKLFFVFENVRLDFMLKTFREGANGHMAFVQRINDQGEGDPYYETIGILTLEDVLEELLQAEIMDESDIGKHEARLTNGVRPKNSAAFALMRRKPKTRVELPAPLALATVQFLTTSVEPFSKTILSLSILKRLVSNCAHYIKLPRHRGNIPDIILYEEGKPSEYFMIILEGRVEVTVGKEKLTYESGAFTTFGKDFLISALAADKVGSAPSTAAFDKPDTKSKKRTFTPDYTVRVATNLHYLMLKYSAYKAAILATGIERSNADPTQAHSNYWQEEIDKILEKISSYDDDAGSETSRRPRISRDESFRAPNITFGENEGITRKISFPVIGESGFEKDEQTGLLPDAIYMKTPIIPEEKLTDEENNMKEPNEETKLLK